LRRVTVRRRRPVENLVDQENRISIAWRKNRSVGNDSKLSFRLNRCVVISYAIHLLLIQSRMAAGVITVRFEICTFCGLALWFFELILHSFDRAVRALAQAELAAEIEFAGAYWRRASGKRPFNLLFDARKLSTGNGSRVGLGNQLRRGSQIRLTTYY
jgi:hypothetical protein